MPRPKNVFKNIGDTLTLVKREGHGFAVTKESHHAPFHMRYHNALLLHALEIRT